MKTTSEATVTYSTGSVRSADTEHVRYDLIPPAFLEVLAMRYAKGAEKYGDANWTLGQPFSAILRHAFKHLVALTRCPVDAVLDGEDFCEHAAAVAWAMAALIYFVDEAGVGDLDDRIYIWRPHAPKE